MNEEYKSKIKFNNEELIHLKDIVKKYHNKDIKIDIYNVDEIDDVNELKKIMSEQESQLNQLNILIDIEEQKIFNESQKKIEQLKNSETDKEFSNFYRNGKVEIKGVETEIDRLFIKKMEASNGNVVYRFVCTDKKILGTILKEKPLEGYKMNKIFKFKDSKVFYNIYLEKRIYADGKLKLNTDEDFACFNEYLSNWTEESHNLVAETMN